MFDSKRSIFIALFSVRQKKVKNGKNGYNNGMCFTQWLIVMTTNVPESILV